MPWLGNNEVEAIRLATKDYIWGPNEHRFTVGLRKKEGTPCFLDGAPSPQLNSNFKLTIETK
jgi:hypothetical protein